MSKWCVDCRHAREMHSLMIGWVCWRQISEDPSPVTGKPVQLKKHCDQERVDPTGCGPDGKFFEERPPNGR